MTSQSDATNLIELDIWGTRGSRNLIPPRSAIGNNTSCYSLLLGEEIVVLDGGRGLAALGHAIGTEKRFEPVRRVSLFVGHAHMDHWEGLKDCDWFWSKANRLELKIFGPGEALRVIQKGYGHPSFVPLEILAEGNLADISFHQLESGQHTRRQGWEFETFSLYHYSGSGDRKRNLDTLGIRIHPRSGEPVLCYLCDHEPTEQTREMEVGVLDGAHVALLDAHFLNIADHAYGHGSQEHAAKIARAFPNTLVLATHHGPTWSDHELQGSFALHSQGLRNLRLAVEGTTYRWDPENKAYVEKPLDEGRASGG